MRNFFQKVNNLLFFIKITFGFKTNVRITFFLITLKKLIKALTFYDSFIFFNNIQLKLGASVLIFNIKIIRKNINRFYWFPTEKISVLLIFKVKKKFVFTRLSKTKRSALFRLDVILR